MLIDSHVHITKNGKWFDTSFDASEQYLLRSMSEAQVNKAILIPIAPFIENKFVQEITKRYPDNFIGFCSADPKDAASVSELAQYCASGDFSGVKIHPRLQQVSLREQNVQRIVDVAADRNLPVLIDAWIGPHDMNGKEFIGSFVDLSRNNSDVVFILPHLGGFMYKSMIPVADECKNIVFDISYFFSRLNADLLHREICPVLEGIGHKRIIYGSDFPEIRMDVYKKITDNLLDFLKWPDGWREDIFCRNILKILGT